MKGLNFPCSIGPDFRLLSPAKLQVQDALGDPRENPLTFRMVGVTAVAATRSCHHSQITEGPFAIVVAKWPMTHEAPDQFVFTDNAGLEESEHIPDGEMDRGRPVMAVISGQ